ncbi:glutamyl-tRNA(Gln) amidotransferase [Rhizoctonia solani AG-1 IA]|uniref:Glutamyl-tRNA(Gln) amidotransferase subunit B, mitochondrial n=1 Tax=Thanatephorus cucumeris (strain AG1-IA) TaxID=983506 RepID=L8WKC3_THACA|nr:glutamyl-tRNA(Gln) amidotransferase [Rhizoctonia solani AG-1 IA]
MIHPKWTRPFASFGTRATRARPLSEWQSVIGIEVHAQIKSRKKLFSGLHNIHADASPSVLPGDRVSIFDAAFPGCLPHFNNKCLDLAIRTSLALGSDVQQRSSFDRKHYFYPDLPSGGGSLQLLGYDGKLVRIQQIQLEQASIHQPLWPTLHAAHDRSPEEAAAYVRSLQALLRAVGSSDGNMELGSMRCDVNISLNRPGEPFGTRCEIKNLNTIRGLVVALNAEIERHKNLLDQGLPVLQETRGFNEDTAETFRLRSKEGAPDYRYMPDPNLPPLVIEQEYIERIRAHMPTLPTQTRERLVSTYKLSSRDVDVLMGIDAGADVGFDGEEPSRLGAVAYFESVVRGGRDPKIVANWLLHELIGQLSLRSQTFADNPLTPERLGELVDAVESHVITGTSGKLLMRHLIETRSNLPLSQIIESLGLRAASSTSELTALCRTAISMLPKESELVAQGNDRVLMKVVGQVMRLSKGTADAQAAREELLRQLRK